MEMYQTQYERDLEKIVWEPKPHRCLEIWRDNNYCTDTAKEELIQDTHIGSWAAREPKKHPNHRPSAGVRLILINRCGQHLQTSPPSTLWEEPHSWPFSRDSFKAVMQNFRLPPMLVSDPNCGVNHSMFGQGTNYIRYHVRTPRNRGQRFHCALSLDKRSMITSGIIVATHNYMLDYVISQLIRSSASSKSPAHVLTIVSEHLARKSREISYDNVTWMCRLEYTSGEHNWAGVDKKVNGIPQHEYRGLTADLATIGTVIGANEGLCCYQQSFNQFIIDCMDCGMCSGIGGDQAQCQCMELKEYLIYLTTAAKCLVMACQNQQAQVQRLMSAVLSRIAQQDSLTNVEVAQTSQTIAVASKRDSAAMKTLAAMTMIFLPGTFVSTLFALPLFDWQANFGTSVVKPRFWIYWVVTIPLTFVTIGIWLVWVRQRIAKNEKEELLASHGKV